MVNGNPGSWFKHRKGLRQGDSLSPYLFILVADVFAKFIDLTRSHDTIHGVKINDNMEIINLEFADDFLVYTRGSEDDILNLKILLLGFEFMTGLQVNFSKTSVTHLSNDSTKATAVSRELGCWHLDFPIKYLGLPLRNSRILKSDWLEVIEKIDSRLASWKDTVDDTWRFSWRHLVDESRVDELVYIIRNTHLSHDLDSIAWKWEANRCFSTASLYLLMKNDNILHPRLASIWKGKPPLKIKMVFWLILRNRILTRARLCYLGVTVDDTRCVFYMADDESCEHLFSSCRPLSAG
ncbi:hypothetical protein Cni_G05505 [Canna indica]|uniref:Reverse transcriptase domain-containing protein n=1 Tax=Canna indica TaxID=4628 RepID=A0AAQ3JXA9_9LILI|nr:hypothetical protein Cni_G05505 [Canna indica]